MKIINFFIFSFTLSFGGLAFAKNQDLSLVVPKADIHVPDPEVKKSEKATVPSKPLTALEMSKNLTLQPRLEYENYLDIKPTKPQTFGFNLNWDI